MHLVAHRRAWDQQVALLLSGSQPPLSVGPHITQSRCTCNAIHGVQTSTRHQKAVGALGNQTHLTGCLTTSQTPYQQQKMPDIRFSPSFPPFSAVAEGVASTIPMGWSTRSAQPRAGALHASSVFQTLRKRRRLALFEYTWRFRQVLRSSPHKLSHIHPLSDVFGAQPAARIRVFVVS